MMKRPIFPVLGRFPSLAFVAPLLAIFVVQTQADNHSHLDSRTQALLKQLEHKYKSGMQYLPGYGVQETDSPNGLPRVYAPTRPRESSTRYAWKMNIVTTIFWVGEPASAERRDPGNEASSWDTKWLESYGGHDSPDPSQRTYDFRPKAFVPGQNPFYIALPYNDLLGWRKPRPEASRVIPWYKERFEEHGKTLLKGQWIAIRLGSKICYAQWEDVGPFVVDDWQYVFGDARPKTTGNKGAGLDVSPAVRDFLGLRSGQMCDWRFVDLDEVPTGPWRKYGANNPFVNLRAAEQKEREARAAAQKKADQERLAKLREARDKYVRDQLMQRRF